MGAVDYNKLNSSFLRFTAICGDESGGEFFSKFFTDFPDGISWDVMSITKDGAYGSSINGILVALYIEGEADWFTLPKATKLCPFSKTNRTWRLDIPLTKETRNKFLSKIDVQRFVFENIKILEKKSPPAKQYVTTSRQHVFFPIYMYIFLFSMLSESQLGLLLI